jgi:hypothetical protein
MTGSVAAAESVEVLTRMARRNTAVGSRYLKHDENRSLEASMRHMAYLHPPAAKGLGGYRECPPERATIHALLRMSKDCMNALLSGRFEHSAWGAY